MQSVLSKILLRSLSILLSAVILFTAARVDLAFSDDDFSFEKTAKGDRKTFLFEKKADANTQKSRISIRFVLANDVFFAKPQVILFLPSLTKERISKIVPHLTATCLCNSVEFLKILFRFYISVNAP